jgi:hypothetical protein
MRPVASVSMLGSGRTPEHKGAMMLDRFSAATAKVLGS